MKPPICRLCKTAHWPKESCKWPVTLTPDSDVTLANEVKTLTLEPAKVTETVKVTAKVTSKRTDYMREYMRRNPQKKRDRAEYMRKYRKGK